MYLLFSQFEALFAGVKYANFGKWQSVRGQRMENNIREFKMENTKRKRLAQLKRYVYIAAKTIGKD